MYRFIYVLTISGIVFLSSCKKESQDIFITDVFEYVYAPGQHASLALKTDIQYIKGDPAKHNKWLYLGGFGGYVIAGFPVEIKNHEGADIEIYALKGAGPEPAVVYVMQDVNQDGIPNETWYELKGNQTEFSDRYYELTYFKPGSITSNIKWKDNKGVSGELVPGYGSINSSGWWWSETRADSIKFTGTLLPDAYDNIPVNGVDYWTVPVNRFQWGYAENQFGTDFDSEKGVNKLDISNAIDSGGNSISLSGIRFIKIQSSVFQIAGMTNEVSSEIRGARAIPAD